MEHMKQCDANTMLKKDSTDLMEQYNVNSVQEK